MVQYKPIGTVNAGYIQSSVYKEWSESKYTRPLWVFYYTDYKEQEV